jgi:acetyltransferase-like isoleucine patch superfamily enzyme
MNISVKKIKILLQLLICIFPNSIKIKIYEWVFNAKIGNDVKIGFGAILIFKNLQIGDSTIISPLCVIRVRELQLGKRVRVGMFTRISVYGINLGSSVTIGSQVSILASSENPECTFSAGAESWIFDYCYINPEKPIKLGRNVGVGGGSYIFGHGLWLSKLNGYPVNYGEINIGNDVWLPWGCFIMPGISIGDGVVVGARSVITKNVPAGSLVAGSPAKVIRETAATEISDEIKNNILDEITRDFCQSKKLKLNVRENFDWVQYEINGNVEIAIAKYSSIKSYPLFGVNTLFVIRDEICNGNEFDKNNLYSLKNSQSSSRDKLSEVQAAWLINLRSIGVRYYPIDEVNLSD